MTPAACERCGSNWFLSSPNYGSSGQWAHYCSRTGHRETYMDENAPTPAESYAAADVDLAAERKRWSGEP